MAATVDTHLFGSRRGYECLAKSSAVTAAEDRVLSEFGFGQNSDERFLQGLATRPTAFARPLPGGRIAITRVLNGPLDDGGRPTLERRTILVTAREYLVVRHDLTKLIADTRLWSAGAFGTGGTLPLPSIGGRAVPASDMSWRIFDAWVSALERPPHGVVVGSDDISAQAVLLVVSQLADADALRFSWGIRLLSPIAWVDVATLSPFGAMDGRRPVFGISQGDCVNEAVRRAQTSSPTRLPSVDSLRARDVEPVEVRASGKAGPRRQVSGELDLRARAALRQRKLLLGIAALIVAACSLSVALYFAFSRPTTGGLGEQGFVNSGGGGLSAPPPSEAAHIDTSPSSATVLGSEPEKSTSPDSIGAGPATSALVSPGANTESTEAPAPSSAPAPAPVSTTDPAPAPAPTPPPPPHPPSTDHIDTPEQQPWDLSQEDKAKVREMIEWSKKVRRVETVWRGFVAPLVSELEARSKQYKEYVARLHNWNKKIRSTNPALAGSQPMKPPCMEEDFPNWESIWLVKQVDQVQQLQLKESTRQRDDCKDVKAFLRDTSKGDSTARMHVLALVMQEFLYLSAIRDFQQEVGAGELKEGGAGELQAAKVWGDAFAKFRRESDLFNALGPFGQANSGLDVIADFISLRSSLAKQPCNLKDDELRFFPKGRKSQSYSELYDTIMAEVSQEMGFAPEYIHLQEEVSAAMNALPPAP